MEARVLYSVVTLTSNESQSIDVEDARQYANTNNFIGVSSFNQRPALSSGYYQGFDVVEYNKTGSPTLFPAAGTTVTGVTGASIALDLSAGPGAVAYSEFPGTFDVYLATDSTTPLAYTATTNVKAYDTTTADGTDGTNSYGSSASTLLGTVQLTSSTPTGYSTYALTPTSAEEQTLATDLTNGTPIRVVIAANGSTATTTAGDVAADFTKNATLSLSAVTSTPLAEPVSFSTAAYSVNANNAGGDVVVDVTRGGPTSDTETVNYATADGTAAAGTNYTAAAGTLTFAAGQTVAAVTVPVTAVASQGGNKTFTLTLSSPSTNTPGSTVGSLGSAATTTVTVVDPATLTNTLSGGPTTVTDVEQAGPYSTANAPVIAYPATGAGALGYAAFEVLEFSPGTTPSVYPAVGTTVNSLSNLSLKLDNITNGTAAVAGDFNLYYVPNSDATTATSSLAFMASDPGGVNGQAGIVAADLIGTFSFNATAGYDTYTAAAIPSGVANALVSALNGGQSFRLAVAAQTAGFVSVFAGTQPGEQPVLSLSAATTQTSTVDQFDLSSPTYSVAETAGSVTVTVNRSQSTASAASISYATSDQTAAAGTNYTATAGTLTFAAGQTSASFTVPILDAQPQRGDKQFLVTLSNATAAAANTLTTVGQSTATVTVVDSVNTATNTQTLSTNSINTSTIEPAGPVAGANNSSYLDVLGSTNSTNGLESFGTADFNVQDGTGFTFNPTNPVSAIDGITIGLVTSNYSYAADGPLDVYLVSDATTDVTNDGNSPVKYESVDPEGINGQLGTKYLLGTVNFVKTSSTATFTQYPLLNYSPAGYAALIGDVNGNLPFRLAIASEAPGASGAFVGGGGTIASGPGGPELTLNVTEGSVNTLPAYLDPASQATYSATTNTVTVTGPTTIVADPGSAAPNVVASGSAATLTVNTSSGSQVHLASLSLANGATATLAASPPAVVLEVAGGLSVDSTSTLNLGAGDLDVANGSLSALTALVTRGYDGGAWTGTGITSSAAAGRREPPDGGRRPVEQRERVGPRSGRLRRRPAVAATDVLLKYTYYGDANLDGVVNGTDYALVDAGFLAARRPSPLTGWYNGDFNYDGKVDASDYTLIDNAFNLAKTPLSFSAQLVAGPAAVVAAVRPIKATPFSVGAPITAATPTTAVVDQDKKAGLADQVDDLIAKAK